MFVPVAYAFIIATGAVLSAVFLCPEFEFASEFAFGPEEEEEEEEEEEWDDEDDEDDEDNEDDDWDYEWERTASVPELELMGLQPNTPLFEVSWRKAA